MELKSKMPELDESTLLKLEVCSSVSIFKEMIPRFIGYFIHVGKFPINEVTKEIEEAIDKNKLTSIEDINNLNNENFKVITDIVGILKEKECIVIIDAITNFEKYSYNPFKSLMCSMNDSPYEIKLRKDLAIAKVEGTSLLQNEDLKDYATIHINYTLRKLIGNDIVFKYRSFFSVIELLQARCYFYEVTTSANINDRIRRYISY